MLAELAARISALGPRFGLPLQTIQAVEAQAGRKRAVAFAREHHDLTVKAIGVALADVVLGAPARGPHHRHVKAPTQRSQAEGAARALRQGAGPHREGDQLMDIVIAVAFFFAIVYVVETYIGA